MFSGLDISMDNPAGAEMVKSRGQLPNNGYNLWNTETFCNKTFFLDVNLSERNGEVTSGIFDCHVSFRPHRGAVGRLLIIENVTTC